MKRIAFVVYRKWAHEICKGVQAFQNECPDFVVSTIITTPAHEFDAKGISNLYIVEGNNNERIASILSENKIDIVCYYGWSWIIKDPILSSYICLCLHPSPLPKYRGGSPIQHQIISGETESAVSVFRIGKGLDDGDVYMQQPMSLSGTIEDIFNQMVSLGVEITKQFIVDSIHDKVIFTPQQHLVENPPLKRRTVEQSKLTLKQIKILTYEELYNFVRALTSPYPNAQISFPEGELFLQEVQKHQQKGEGGLIVDDFSFRSISKDKKVLLQVADGYAIVKKYRKD